MRCSKCGQLKPQLAVGMSPARNLADRLLVYEGYSPMGKPFRYTGSDLCLSCRTPKKATVTLHKDAKGEALKQWLIAENERR